MKRQGKLWSILGLFFASFSLLIGSLAHLSGVGAIETRAEESTSTLTFTKACGGSGTADDGVAWTVASDGSESNFDNTKGIHYGTSSDQVTYITLSTSGISGTITKIIVNASTASKVSATVSTTVGGSAFGGAAQSLSTSAADYTFNGSASGEIVVTVTKPSSATKALYVKSVAVTYEKPAAIQYDIDTSSSASNHWTWKGSDGVSAGPNKTNTSGATIGKIVVDSGYRLPNTINATPEGKVHYNGTTGEVTIDSNVGGNVTISAAPIKTRNVEWAFDNADAEGNGVVDSGGDGTITITPYPGYSFPENKDFEVTGISTWSLDRTTGVFSFTSDGEDDIIIMADMVQDIYDVEITISGGSVYSSGSDITDTTTVYGGAPFIFFQHAEGYGFPASSGDITVTGATIDAYEPVYTTEPEIACLLLKNVTGPVSVTINCTPDVYDITTTIEGSHGTYDGDTTIVRDGSASVTISPAEGYELPTDVTVIGATKSYNSSTGIISLSNPTGDVTINVTMDALTRYEITVTLPDGSATKSGATYIYDKKTADVTITPNDGYVLNPTITVTGADYTWDDSTGVIHLSNPDDDVAISGVVRALEIYDVTVTVTGGTYTKSQNTLREDQSMTVTLTPSEGYKLPTDVTVTNASKSYNSSTGVVSISNPTDDVAVSAAMIALTKYTITVSQTNATHTGDSYIYSERTAELVFTPDSGCFLPNSITVTGCSYTWSKATGTISLSNPTGNVEITVNAAAKTLDHITVSATKTSFTIGDAFSFAGTITAYDNDDTSQTIPNNDANLSFTGYDRYTIGSQTITVNYKGKTDTYSVTVAAAAAAHHYEKVTTTGDLASGDYLIVYETGSVALNGSLAAGSIDSTSNTISVTISNGRISASTAVDNARFTWDSETGKLRSHAASPYYIGASGTGNQLETGDSLVNTITINSLKNATITSGSSLTLKFNDSANQLRFRYYGSGQKVIQMYRYVQDDPEMVGISASLADPDKTYYDEGTLTADDFNVNIVYGDGTTEPTSEFVFAYPGSQVALIEGTNVITVTYAPGGVPTSDTDILPITAASHGDASVIKVELIEGSEVKRDYYYAPGIEWDLTDLTVSRQWDDPSQTDEISLADLVATGDASISPAVPNSDTTSFSVSYTYHDVDIDDNAVLVTMHPDEASALGWTGRGTVDCFAGTTISSAVNTASWAFNVTWKSGADNTVLDVNNVGTGADEIHLGLYDTSTPSSEGTALALDYAFTAEDNGKYLVAFYKNGHTIQNSTVTITPRLNSIKREAGTTSGYFRVESVSELSAGDQVIIAEASTGTSVQTAKAYSKDYHNIRTVSATQSITGSLYELTPVAGTEIYTLESGSVENTWSFKENSTDKYISAASSSDNYAKSVDTKNGDASFELSISMGQVTAVAQGAYTRNILQYNPNNGTPLFSFYSSEQHALSLFKYLDHVPAAEFANVNLKAQKAVIEFAEYFNEQMSAADVCGADIVDASSSAFNTAWTNVSNRYTALFVTENTGADAGTYGAFKLTAEEVSYAKAMLQYGYGTWDNDTRGGNPGVERDCLQRALKTYDFVVLNYEKAAFMSTVRTPSLAAYIPYSRAKDASPLTTTLWIVLGSGLAGLTAIGGAYLFSKKKQRRDTQA